MHRNKFVNYKQLTWRCIVEQFLWIMYYVRRTNFLDVLLDTSIRLYYRDCLYWLNLKSSVKSACKVSSANISLIYLSVKYVCTKYQYLKIFLNFDTFSTYFYIFGLFWNSNKRWLLKLYWSNLKPMRKCV